MQRGVRAIVLIAVGVVLPQLLKAQGFESDVNNLHNVLDKLYEDMLPLCSRLISVGSGIGGFAATWYIASRVWRHLANAEPIDFYPLFRPFVIGFAILTFPGVLAMINGVMKPTVTATSLMVKDTDKAIAVLLQKKEDAIKQSTVWQMYVGETGSGDRDKWYKYTHPDDKTVEGVFESIGDDVKFAMAKASYNFRNSIKEWMSEVLKVLFIAAALCINTIRTFYLVVLAILGPLVFGIAVFDGFQYSLTIWIARYINVFLWLPVANIFGSIIGKVQEKMLELDIQQVQDTGDTFFSSTDTAYLVFMIIGIIGYLTVPSVANYIVNAGSGNTLLYHVNSFFKSSSGSVARTATGTTGMLVESMGTAAARMTNSMTTYNSTSGYVSDGDKHNASNSYLQSKLSGK
jgi:conjugative transposon TraJ protein